MLIWWYMMITHDKDNTSRFEEFWGRRWQSWWMTKYDKPRLHSAILILSCHRGTGSSSIGRYMQRSTMVSCKWWRCWIETRGTSVSLRRRLPKWRWGPKWRKHSPLESPKSGIFGSERCWFGRRCLTAEPGKFPTTPEIHNRPKNNIPKHPKNIPQHPAAFHNMT